MSSQTGAPYTALDLDALTLAIGAHESPEDGMCGLRDHMIAVGKGA